MPISCGPERISSPAITARPLISSARSGISKPERELNITFREAGESDAPVVAALLSQAAAYLESIGQPLWDEQSIAGEQLLRDIEQHRYVLAEIGGIPKGTLRFQLEDRDFWPEITDGNSAFVHKLAVSRDVAGTGLSRELLIWAIRETRRIGRRWLRLDAVVRPKLMSVYEEFGFSPHSEKTVGRFHVMRYELDTWETAQE